MKQHNPLRILVAGAAISFALLLVLYTGSHKTLYDFLADFQDFIGTLVTGLLGFAGIIYTMERSAEHTLAEQQHDHSHQSQVLRRALAAELSAMHRDLTFQQNSLEQTEKQYGENMPAPRPHTAEAKSVVYQSMCSGLGLLEPRQAEAVVLAYSQFAELCDISTWCDDVQTQWAKSGQPIAQIYSTYRKTLTATLLRVKHALDALNG